MVTSLVKENLFKRKTTLKNYISIMANESNVTKIDLHSLIRSSDVAIWYRCNNCLLRTYKFLKFPKPLINLATVF